MGHYIDKYIMYPPHIICKAIFYSGVYIDDELPDDQSMFITERHCFYDIVTGLASPCSCGTVKNPWMLDSIIQVVSAHYTSEFYFYCTERTCIESAIFMLCVS